MTIEKLIIINSRPKWQRNSNENNVSCQDVQSVSNHKGIHLFEANNYQKQKRKVARLHEKLVHQRTYFFNNLSTEIIKNHDIIYIEDLSVKGMLRNHKLEKSISDVS